MTDWQRLAPLAEVPLGAIRAFEFAADTVAVAHTAEGVFAISDTCSHAEVSLAEGELRGCLVECWMHGSAFDLRTGIPQGPPAITPVLTYPVRLVGAGDETMIEIQIGGEK